MASSRGALALGFAVILLAALPRGAHASENCHRLEPLSIQYKGVELNADQKEAEAKTCRLVQPELSARSIRRG